MCLLTAAVRLVTVLVYRVSSPEDADALTATTLTMLVTQFLHGGLDAVASLVVPAVEHVVAHASVQLQSDVTLHEIDALLKLIVNVRGCGPCGCRCSNLCVCVQRLRGSPLDSDGCSTSFHPHPIIVGITTGGTTPTKGFASPPPSRGQYVLECVWDVLESPAYAPAYDVGVGAGVDVVLGDLARTLFPGHMRPHERVVVVPDEAQKPVKLVHVVIGLRACVQRVLGGTGPERCGDFVCV